MILKTTLKQPDYIVKQLIREAIKFTFAGQNFEFPEHFKIWAKNSSSPWAGRYYCNSKIVLRIGKPNCFPRVCKYPRLKTAPEYVLNDWQEALFALTVHESFHHIQYRTKSPYSEIETERMTVKGLEYFRSIRNQLNCEFQEVEEQIKLEEIKKSNLEIYRETPEYQLEQVKSKLERWMKKSRMAQNKVKKLTRKYNNLERKISKVNI